MKYFIRTVLTCLLACIALSGRPSRDACGFASDPYDSRFPIAPRGNQLVIGALAQHSLFRIEVDDSSDSEIDDHHAAKSHKHGKSGADAIVTGSSYRLDAGESTNGAVVLIGGNGEINGTVNGDLVLIGSKATFAGTVNGDLVTIGSTLTFMTGAVANGDYVSVASEIKGEQELTANGERVALNAYTPLVPVLKEALDQHRSAPADVALFDFRLDARHHHVVRSSRARA